MIVLSKLEQEDFSVFKSWVNNQDELFAFAGSIFKYPITDEQLVCYINDSRRIVYAVKLETSNEIIGNAELNLENGLPRLSRIIIGNAEYRGRGLGKMVVNKMLEKVFLEFDFETVDLNVFDWNKVAIHCYKSVGFVQKPEVVYEHVHNNSIWTALNMTLSKNDWLAKN